MEPAAKHINSVRKASNLPGPGGLFFQPKLAVNNPGDQYEREANAVAEKIMQKSPLQTQANDNSFFKAGPVAITPVQRKCDHCKEEEKMQRKEIDGEEAVGDNELENYVGGLSDGGDNLPGEVRGFFEPCFGYNFSNVKLHTDNNAARSAQSINALAYTTGNNIVFNNGQYQPGTDSGKRLLGHELTHVVQQNSNNNIQPATIQTTLGDGHDLTSPRLRGNEELEKTYDSERTIDRGETGEHVSKIQHAISDHGRLFSRFGVDGIFERETRQKVIDFQRDRSVRGDSRGVVGQNTIAELNSMFAPVAAAGSASAVFDFNCMRNILCEWNRAMLRDLRNIRVFLADRIWWADEEFDGTVWNLRPFEGGGATTRSRNEIIVRQETCEITCGYLYHEYQHRRLPRRLASVWGSEEDYAYRIESMWSASRFGSSTMGTTSTTSTGELVVDDAAIDSTVSTYPGVTVGSNETVISKVGATRVRVQRENGTVYVRNAVAGDSVPGRMHVDNKRRIPANEFYCP